jgi:hypothetical protein
MSNTTVKYPTATTACQRGNDFVVTYHKTDVVIIRADGSIVINTGGYLTKTTAHRINQYAPGVQFNIHKNQGFVTFQGKEYIHYEGMILHTNGGVTTNDGDRIAPRC